MEHRGGRAAWGVFVGAGGGEARGILVGAGKAWEVSGAIGL